MNPVRHLFFPANRVVVPLFKNPCTLCGRPAEDGLHRCDRCQVFVESEAMDHEGDEK
jgi:hypothetical protein